MLEVRQVVLDSSSAVVELSRRLPPTFLIPPVAEQQALTSMEEGEELHCRINHQLKSITIATYHLPNRHPLSRSVEPRTLSRPRVTNRITCIRSTVVNNNNNNKLMDTCPRIVAQLVEEAWGTNRVAPHSIHLRPTKLANSKTSRQMLQFQPEGHRPAKITHLTHLRSTQQEVLLLRHQV